MLLEALQLERTEQVVSFTTPLTVSLAGGYGDPSHGCILFCDTPGPYIAKLLLKH